MGDENAFLYRTTLYLISSASAEFFADIALSPMEACKVSSLTCIQVCLLSLFFLRSECRPHSLGLSQLLSGGLFQP